MIGKESKNDCPRCCLQCVEACQICIKYMIADSRFVKDYCLLCAQVCEWCAEECAQHDSEHCQKCAASCLACAAECRTYAA